MRLKLGSPCVFAPAVPPVNLSMHLSAACFYSTNFFKGWSHCCLVTTFCFVGQVLLICWTIVMEFNPGVYIKIINNRLVTREIRMILHWRNYPLLNRSKLRIGEHLPLHSPGDKDWIKDHGIRTTVFQPGTWILSLKKRYQKLRSDGFLYVCFALSTDYQHKYHFLSYNPSALLTMYSNCKQVFKWCHAEALQSGCWGSLRSHWNERAFLLISVTRRLWTEHDILAIWAF